MIQISTPTQAINSLEAGNQEGGNLSVKTEGESSGAWERLGKKKNRNSIFATLLEGLTAKGKTGFSREAKLEKVADPESETGEKKTGKLSRKTNGAFKPETPGDVFSELITFDQASGEKAIDFDYENEALFLFRDTKPTLEVKVSHNKLEDFSQSRSLDEEVFRRMATLKPDQRESLDLPATKTGKTALEPSLFSDGEKPKTGSRRNAEAAPVSFSFREAEAELVKTQLSQLKNEVNGKDNSRLSEFRAKKGRERLNIEVRDLRTGEVHSANSSGYVQSAGRLTDSFGFLKSFGHEVEIPVELNASSEAKGEAEAGKSGADVSNSRLFEDALARELRGSLSTDIVRNATVIVRNGGEGTIRLSLRPESLGDVKIRLEMTENKITGHIILESNEALRAFERELPVLEKAFRDSGFSETNLEMFLAQDSPEQGGNYFGSGDQKQDGDYAAMAAALAASRYESELETIDGSSGFDASDYFQSGQGGADVSPPRKTVNFFV